MWLGVLLLFVSLASAVHPKPWTTLQLEVKPQPKVAPVQPKVAPVQPKVAPVQPKVPEPKVPEAKAGPVQPKTKFPPSAPKEGKDSTDYGGDDYGGDDNQRGKNGFPILKGKLKKEIEECVLDPFMDTQLDCGNNPYAGLVRLCFHDCGTSDPSQPTDYLKAGCGGWMSKKCDDNEKCEWNNPDNAGLQMWVQPLETMYQKANVNGKDLEKIISRNDFWQLACYHAIRKSSAWKVSPNFSAGRKDPVMPEPGPRFSGRLPDAHAWSEMQRVGKRNGMNDFASAALLGAHTLGQCHPSTSGYQGSWDSTQYVFDEKMWSGMLDGKWHLHNIDSVDPETGKPRTKTQFSLGGNNFERSVMLFADMGMHFDLEDAKCDWANGEVAAGTCPIMSSPFGLQSALRNWADVPQTFYTAFEGAWEAMTLWGPNCDSVYDVPDYKKDVDCQSYYKHTCRAGYSEKPATWNPGWNSPAPPPTTTKSKGGYTQSPQPTTQPPYKPTTQPPYKPTTQPPYKPTTQPPYKPTTKPPTTTTKPPIYTTTQTGTVTKRPPSTIPPTTKPPTTTKPPVYTTTQAGTVTKRPPSTIPPTTTARTTTSTPTTTYTPTTTTCAPTTTNAGTITRSPPSTVPPTTTQPTTTPETTVPPTTTPEETTTPAPTTTPEETTTPPPTTTPEETTTPPPTTTPEETTTCAPTTTPETTQPPTTTPEETTPPPTTTPEETTTTCAPTTTPETTQPPTTTPEETTPPPTTTPEETTTTCAPTTQPPTTTPEETTQPPTTTPEETTTTCAPTTQPPTTTPEETTQPPTTTPEETTQPPTTTPEYYYPGEPTTTPKPTRPPRYYG